MEKETLSEDIVIEILSWLPKKYFHRFKCVSKRWNAFLSSLPRPPPQKTAHSGFILQTNLLPTRLLATFFLLDDDDDAVPHRSLTFCFDGNSISIQTSNPDENIIFTHSPRSSLADFSIAASCNGLLLLRTLLFRKPSFHVYNPSSNFLESLPPPPTNLNTNHVGFAFDGGHYKVVYLSQRPHCRGSVLVFRIFSSLTSSWRERVVMQFSWKLPEMRAVFARGNLYWLGKEYLLIFRCSDDRHLFVELPEHDKQFLSPRNGGIWVVEGCLEYCDCVLNRLRIWALHSEGPSSRPGFCWKLKHDVVPRFADSPSTYIPNFKWDFFPCGFDDDVGIVYLWLKREDGVLVSCNIATGVMKRLSRCRSTTSFDFIPFFYGGPTSLSLQQPKRTKDEDEYFNFPRRS